MLDVERGDVETALRRFDEAIALLPPSELFPFLSASLNILIGNTEAIRATADARKDFAGG